MHSLTFLGHAVFLLEHDNGTRILVDPWITGNPLYPQDYDLGHIDLILVTHGHYDHITGTPELAIQKGAQVVSIFELCMWLQKKGVEKINPMNKGGTINLYGIDITMVHADHSCGITEDDGSITYGGSAVGFCS